MRHMIKGFYSHAHQIDDLTRRLRNIVDQLVGIQPPSPALPSPGLIEATPPMLQDLGNADLAIGNELEGLRQQIARLEEALNLNEPSIGASAGRPAYPEQARY